MKPIRYLLLLPLLIVALNLAAFGQGKRQIDYIETTSLETGTKSTTSTDIEERKPVVHKTIITLNDLSISLSDTNVGGGTKIYDFPEGRILILGGIAKSITPTTTTAILTTLNGSKTLSLGVGTVQTTTQGSGTLATTEQDVISAFVCTTCSSATINVAGSAANGADDGTPQGFDGTTTAKDLFLNVGVPTANDIDGDATITVTGTITIYWILLGDY